MGFADDSLLDKFLRDGRLPGPQFLAKMARVAVEAATAPLYLRACTSVGPLVRTQGRPIIENSGRIDLATRVYIISSPVAASLRTGKHGLIEMRRGSIAGYGSVIYAEDRVTVGEGVGVGPFSVVSDSEGPGEPPRPIEIGAGVWIGAHVTVLPGARIGKDAVIGAGSVVEGDIPDGAIAAGIPARVKRQRRPRPNTEPSQPPRRESSERARAAPMGERRGQAEGQVGT
ncbi:MAG: hypothetical protein ACJ78X_14915 [Myxococcales bacterium]